MSFDRIDGRRSCWPFAAAALVVLFTVSAAHGAPKLSELTHRCVEIQKRGIFDPATLAADPRLARAVKAAECRANYGSQGLLNQVGFGYGTSVMGQVLIDPLEGGRSGVDGAAARRWHAENCPPGSVAEPWTEDQALWQLAYALVPRAIYAPWRACTDYFQTHYAEALRNLSCVALADPDDDSRVTFEAHYIGDGLFDSSTRLQDDLQVEGATCPAPWRAGSRVGRRYRGRSITCQRQGDATVRFRIASKNLSCEATVPPSVRSPHATPSQ